jgi:hypothetical protein
VTRAEIGNRHRRKACHKARGWWHGMELSLLGFVLFALAVWRVTHLLAEEDGPGRIFARLRTAWGDGFWKSLFGCFYCLSLWVALPFAFGLSTQWGERLIVWLALSGAASLLERVGQQAVAPAVYWEGEKEETDALLRRPAPRNDPPPGSR